MGRTPSAIRSAAVNTPRTPGIAAAAAASIGHQRRMGVRRADEHRVQLPGGRLVVDVAALAAQEPVVLQAPKRPRVSRVDG